MKKQALNNKLADYQEVKPHHQMFILNLLNDLEIFVFNVDMHLVYTHLKILDMPMNYVRLSDQLPIYPKQL